MNVIRQLETAAKGGDVWLNIAEEAYEAARAGRHGWTRADTLALAKAVAEAIVSFLEKREAAHGSKVA